MTAVYERIFRLVTTRVVSLYIIQVTCDEQYNMMYDDYKSCMAYQLYRHYNALQYRDETALPPRVFQNIGRDGLLTVMAGRG